MKGLSLWQPWASLIALKVKRIETRGWSTTYRGPLLIHAAKTLEAVPADSRFTLSGYEIERDRSGLLLRHPDLAWPYRLPLGAAVAVTDLVDVLPIVAHGDNPGGRYISSGWTAVEDYALYVWEQDEAVEDITDQAPFGDFSPGRYAWFGDDIEPIRRPIPMRGYQGLWNVPEDVLEAVGR